ncbi:hypothetical protein J2W28_006951 [Variovorax boronicumulans]|uniref:hypothetical protein n=1 Tax=Variovorax boronicumulans TaxID=436515 RepID=UPI00278593A6|nr:hypothetical protein [Variovorax boronicumulans]MDP9996470.1 hypothetical protein [Variovorax boronicumulans]MDQ0007772.1 hypothetical protein [Variovorax boronicumulans]
MTTFVHCRGCGVQIHETAPTCPKCGAPQHLAGASGAAVTGALTSPPSDYAKTQWYRRRWFLIVSLMTIAPVAALIALTGPMYYDAKGVVKTFPKNFRTSIVIMSVYYLYTLTTPVGSSQQMLLFLMTLVASLVMGFKR